MASKNKKDDKKKKKGKHGAEPPLGVPELNPETRQGLFTLFVLVLAILFGLAAFNLSGGLGRYLNLFNRNLLGVLYPLLPLFLLFVAYSRFRGKNVGLDGFTRFGAGLFIVMLGALIHLVMARPEGVAFGKGLQEGGGYLGMLISYLLEQGTGFWGAVVILSAGVIASLLLALKTSLQSILLPHRAVASWFRKDAKPEDGAEAEDGEDEDEDESEESGKEEAPKPQKLSEKFGIFSAKKVADENPANAPAALAVNAKKVHRKVALPIDLLENRLMKPQAGDIKQHQHVIQRTLENFGIPVEMANYSVGPTVTQYTLKPADGIKLNRITNLSNDLALALAAHPIRIEAPIPGKSLVGIEVPNQAVAVVGLREVVEAPEFRGHSSELRIAIGKDVAGKPWVADLARMPHMLVAGSTGSGKTVCLNSIIVSLLYTNGPDELKLILVDPKRVELTAYNNIPHLLIPAVTDLAKTVNALKWALGEMDRRFTQLSKYGKRDIGAYNATADEKMPYLVIVIDELADLMVSNLSNEVETCIIRLAQMARAVGIHLILATQRPSVDVITGLIKANMPARIAFAVASGTDSRTILDTLGAEKLVGRGDMLFTTAELSKPKRLQGTFVSDAEIRKVTDFIKDHYDAPDYRHEIVEKPAGAVTNGVSFDDGGDDPMLNDAKDVILRAGKASASLLQRRLKVGYARAARILDLLEEQGVIGPGDGAKPREILMPRPEDMGPPVDSDDEEENDGTENGVPKWE